MQKYVGLAMFNFIFWPEWNFLKQLFNLITHQLLRPLSRSGKNFKSLHVSYVKWRSFENHSYFKGTVFWPKNHIFAHRSGIFRDINLKFIVKKLTTYIYNISKFHYKNPNTSKIIAHYFCYLFGTPCIITRTIEIHISK